ncbi:MAG: M20/M25/M40 family metallo-hydrolase, partial [Acidobacteria bacterium]|nr:M20/M25/M40 family metallo-hydrolase [Acidobacteriota bacterium]
MSIPSDTTVAPEEAVRELLASERVRRAFRLFETESERINEEHAAICAVPAPPFGEAERAEYLRAKFVACGLSDAGIDAAGNCVAWRRGQSERPLLVVSAHLDTVFPPGTDFTVRRDGARMRAPGIADDGCGLAALLALARALEECRIETEGSLLFVGTVGEEGEGDLRG